MPELGFKDLTIENYLVTDDMMHGFVTCAGDDEARPIPPSEWAREILSVRLSERVPREVHQLFAVARGAMLYGSLFYPLFTLASEQLFRTAEASIAIRCRQLGAPSEVSRFHSRIIWLCGVGVLSEADVITWDSIRRMRNTTSHPVFQMIWMPGQALSNLATTAADIERLFSTEPVRPPVQP